MIMGGRFPAPGDDSSPPDRAEAAQAEAERDAARAERDTAKVAASAAEGEAKGLREALAEARRQFWWRWLVG
jgi:hypothetical protein